MRFLTAIVMVGLLGCGDAFSQTGSITSAGWPGCSNEDVARNLSFSGTWSGVDESYDVVGCYMPFYGAQSPVVYYSPGPGQGDGPVATTLPGSSTGFETVSVNKEQDEIDLAGAYVWFEHGIWADFTIGSTTYYYWECHGELCLPYCIYVPTGTGCFAAGTKVRVPGGWSAIEDLEAGKLILADDRAVISGVPSAKTITEVKSSSKNLLNLVVGGKQVGTTADHLMLEKDRGWIPAGSLTVGDEVQCDGGSWASVTKTLPGRESRVYNLTIDGSSSFFIGHEDWGYSIRVADSCGPENVVHGQVNRQKLIPGLHVSTIYEWSGNSTSQDAD